MSRLSHFYATKDGESEAEDRLNLSGIFQELSIQSLFSVLASFFFGVLCLFAKFWPILFNTFPRR